MLLAVGNSGILIAVHNCVDFKQSMQLSLPVRLFLECGEPRHSLSIQVQSVSFYFGGC